jgi:hypothetical protein
MRICGQQFTPDILERIRGVLVAELQISRRALSRRVCQWLGWRSDGGDWQKGGCQKALAELDRRQVLELPPPRVAFAPHKPPALEVEEVEWKALHCYHHKTPVAPKEPPSMAEAIRMLGALGGHLGRSRDGPPGAQVLWRGLQRLDTAVQMYLVFTQSLAPNSWRSYPNG